MLKINKPEVAFAVRLTDDSMKESKNGRKLKKLFKLLSAHYPTINIEGTNVDSKSAKYKTTAKGYIHGLPFKICSVKPRNLLCVGVSKRNDISFESEASLTVFGFSLVKILDLEKDFKEIEKRLVKYMLKVYPEQTDANISHGWKKPADKIVRYSTFVEVNGVSMSYSEFNALRKDIIVDTRKKKNENPTYGSFITLIRSLD